MLMTGMRKDLCPRDKLRCYKVVALEIMDIISALKVVNTLSYLAQFMFERKSCTILIGTSF